MTNRRQFLQMLGIGGASLLVTTAAKASPVVPLFSGKESKIWTPEHTSLTRSHLVLTRPKVVPTRAFPVPGGAEWGMRLSRKRWPTVPDPRSYLDRPVLELKHRDDFPHQAYQLGAPSLEKNVPGVSFKVENDPHHAFYKASMQMRDRFAKQSHARLMAIPEWQRPHTTLVTLVDTDIFVSNGIGETLRVEISYTPHTISMAEELELNGWEIYSENGEYPVEIPTDIDMHHLMQVDTDIFTGKLNALQLRGKIITS